MSVKPSPLSPAQTRMLLWLLKHGPTFATFLNSNVCKALLRRKLIHGDECGRVVLSNAGRARAMKL